MPGKRQRLAVRVLNIIEGEAEGALGISVFLLVIVLAMGLVIWRFG